MDHLEQQAHPTPREDEGSGEEGSEGSGDEGGAEGGQCGGGAGGGGSGSEGGEEDEGEGEAVDEKDVIVLTDSNFHSESKKHRFLLVEFFAPWCGHCKALRPEYAKAASILAEADPPVALAQIDATVHEAVGKEFEIDGFPTMKWFVDGKLQGVDVHERSAERLVAWCRKRTGAPAPLIEDADKLSALISASRFLVVGFFQGDIPQGDAWEAFKRAAFEDGGREYYHVTDRALIKEHGVKELPAVLFFRHFDEPKVEFKGAFEADKIIKEVQAHSIRTIVPFSEENAPEIFDNDLVKVLLFGSDLSSDAQADFEKLAMELKGKYIFSTVPVGTEPDLWQFVGADETAQSPQMFLFHPERALKYKLHEAFSLESARGLIDRHEKGEAEPFLKSAEIQEGWDAELVKEVVAKQLQKMVTDKGRSHIVVYVYAPWCGHCQAFTPRYEKAAAYFDSKHGISEVLFVKMDGTQNEMKDMMVTGFPTVFVFPKGMGEAGPTDISSYTENLKDFAREIRTACDITAVKREGEQVYEDAARRFKAAVKQVKGSLVGVAAILNEASERVEALAAAQ